MPRSRKTLPRYLRHTSGRARIVWNDPSGQRREQILPGLYDSPESREAFSRQQLELTTSPTIPPHRLDAGLSVAEVIVSYLRHAKSYHAPGSDLEGIKSALKTVRELYGMTPVAEFGPRALKAVREAFVQKKWSRQYCNRQIGKIIQAFKWAAAEELIPVTQHTALKTLGPLRQGKTDAPEKAPRLPAIPADVEATLPFLPPHTRIIIELIRLTGMRPSEACRMTLGTIDRSQSVWYYTPYKHKTTHRKKSRVVALGQEAQEVIQAYLVNREIGNDEPLFSPRRQREEWFAARRAKRKTKVQPSQISRRKANPKKTPGEWFRSSAVSHAVEKAAKKAGVPAWSPYQLRHLRGAELREQFSLEHVRAALGHSHASMSAHYSTGADRKLATEVAMKAG